MLVNQTFAYFYCFCHFTKWLPSSVLTLAGNDCNYYKGMFFFQYGGQYSKVLRQVTLKTLSYSECMDAYGYRGNITDRVFCAQDPNGGKGACAVRGSL
jgi:hypothetical protein